MLKRSPLRRSSQEAKTSLPVIRKRKCANCKESFRPFTSMVKWCSHECGAALGLKKLENAQAREKQDDRRKTRAQLEALKPRQHWLKKAEEAVNRYVRARDFHLGCVSCDLPASWDGQWHASHFRSVGAASAVRYCLWNIHKACWICNKHFSGRIDAYTPSITARIGQERVDWLRSQTQRVDYQREYLQRLARVFNKKAARREKRNALQG